MKNVNDISKIWDEVNDSLYDVCISYGPYRCLDESVDYVGCFGINHYKDGHYEIYLAKDVKDLKNKEHSRKFISKYFSGVHDLNSLYLSMKHLMDSTFSDEDKLFVKDYEGRVHNVRHIVLDNESRRVVFEI